MPIRNDTLSVSLNLLHNSEKIIDADVDCRFQEGLSEIAVPPCLKTTRGDPLSFLFPMLLNGFRLFLVKQRNFVSGAALRRRGLDVLLRNRDGRQENDKGRV